MTKRSRGGIKQADILTGLLPETDDEEARDALGEILAFSPAEWNKIAGSRENVGSEPHLVDDYRPRQPRDEAGGVVARRGQHRRVVEVRTCWVLVLGQFSD
jgi:hypothetical protein